MNLIDRMRIKKSAQLLAAARQDFGLYCLATHRGYQTPPHLRLMQEKLMAVERGEIDRLMMAKPPRHGGTLTTSHLYVDWVMGRNPGQNVGVVSYNEQIAQELGRAIQRTMKSVAHRAIFPECEVSREVGSSENIETTAGGHVYSISRAGTFTGRGVRLLILDDLIKDAQEASSVTVRKGIIEWYEKVAITRLTPDGKIILISTRWHEGDLQGHVLSQESEEAA